MPTCPQGHDSSDDEFCDVCGLALDAASTGAGPGTPAESTAESGEETCPSCGEPRTGRFCEGCSYDFVAGTGGSAGGSAPVVVANWSAVVSADRDYFRATQEDSGPDAETITFPEHCPDRSFPLLEQEIRIGRRSRSRGVTPEIDLTGPPMDPGISHLHALLLAQPDGGWVLVDPGSTNGTTVNDDPEPVETQSAVPLKDGDRIHIGAWTTITLRRDI